MGGLYHPPSWRGHSSGQRQGAKAGIASAAPLQANHRSAEDCRASQGDPTDSDAPGNPTRKPGIGGGNTWQQQQQPQQQEQQPQPCVGGPYHPPWWRCHGRGRRQPPRHHHHQQQQQRQQQQEQQQQRQRQQRQERQQEQQHDPTKIATFHGRVGLTVPLSLWTTENRIVRYQQITLPFSRMIYGKLGGYRLQETATFRHMG